MVDDYAPVLTIDGPTASGKGTVAQKLAAQLQWHYLDSGALYRLVAYTALQHGVAQDQENLLTVIANQLDCSFKDGCIMLGKNDVTQMIRQEIVGSMASALAVYSSVRQALMSRQRAFQAYPGLVADGRDMGTVVFPQAKLKIFLTASVQARANRRYNQLKEKGIPVNFDALLQDLQLRDERDTGRAVSPLVAAVDAVVIDSSHRSVRQVVQEVWQLLHERMPEIQIEKK